MPPSEYYSHTGFLSTKKRKIDNSLWQWSPYVGKGLDQYINSAAVTQLTIFFLGSGGLFI